MRMTRMIILAVCLGGLVAAGGATASPGFERDVIPTSEGDLGITFIGHATLMFEFAGKVIHVDPVGSMADYSQLPRADLVLVTHEHGDHFDLKAIGLLRKVTTDIILTRACAEKAQMGTVLENGQSVVRQGIRIQAVPAYNIVNLRSPGNPYHPKGVGNGYILTFGDKRVYVAGDTENTPEMKALRDIDIAFLPMNLPYTMTPEMVADAARALEPKILYPYHYGKTDPQRLVELLKDDPEIEVRVRSLS
jgi:L-ascorbate metabolism protein UlaG (beta-lactamase superfamily)